MSCLLLLQNRVLRAKQNKWREKWQMTQRRLNAQCAPSAQRHVLRSFSVSVCLRKGVRPYRCSRRQLCTDAEPETFISAAGGAIPLINRRLHMIPLADIYSPTGLMTAAMFAMELRE